MKWEYHILIRTREIHAATMGLAKGAALATDFMPNGEAMLAMLRDLGQQEWELVSIMPRSSQHNSPMASEELWVFKRPVS